MRKRKVSHTCLLFLALLQISTPSSAEDAAAAAGTYVTRPADVSVAVGEPAEFSCGVSRDSPDLTFIFYGSQRNYSLTCPDGRQEDIPQALYGSCEMKDGESLAVWKLRGTSFSDNGSRVECQQSDNSRAAAAFLLVYDNGSSYSTLIGCVIGAFFGTLLVAGLLYLMLQRSDSLQTLFRGKEEDTITIVED